MAPAHAVNLVEVEAPDGEVDEPEAAEEADVREPADEELLVRRDERHAERSRVERQQLVQREAGRDPRERDDEQVVRDDQHR